MLLRNNWKLISTSQFVNLFRNALRIKESVTPYDLEQSLLRPQHDPLCAELMSRLLHKRSLKKGPDGNMIPNTSEIIQTLDYDTWNMMLAKKFSMLFKNYRKFSIKHLGKDPFEEGQGQKPSQSQDINQHLNSDNEEEKVGHQQQDINQTELLDGNMVAQDTKQKIDDSNAFYEEEEKQEINVFIPRERVTRSRAAKTKAPNDASHQSAKGKKGNEIAKVTIKSSQASSIQDPNQNLVVEHIWSTDILDNLLKTHNNDSFALRFQFEGVDGYGQQSSWKTESLQVMKLFIEDLSSKDPFYIQGQEWNAQSKEEQSQYWSNFVEGDSNDEFDELQYQYNQYNSKGQEVLFRRFHEIPISSRLDILHFLCQNKLDTESPEFMQEIQNLQTIKPSRHENENGQPLKMSEEMKMWLEPINFGMLKALGQITAEVQREVMQEDVMIISTGTYYYFPYFSDTRIYIESLDRNSFELYLEDHDQIQQFIATLRQHEDNEECFSLLEKLTSYLDYLKKFADEMKWKEASKVRKLQTQIRSRRLQDLSKKKLQFGGNSSQLQTDFLHHTQGNVMTRRQIDTVKQKINKNSTLQEEKKKGDGGQERKSAVSKYQELQKEKMEKARLEREKRLQKRMKIKERIATGGLGKRKRGAGGSEDEDDYDDEYDEEDPNKRQKVEGQSQANEQEEGEADEEQEAAEYDINLNGTLINIMQRDKIDVTKILNDTLVIKGNWKLSIEEKSEDFIYKKVGHPDQDELLTELFCEDINDRITLETKEIQDMISLNPNNRAIFQKLIDCQGKYEGYFQYNQQPVNESISFILRKPSQPSKKQFYYEFMGYGENQGMGPFTMEGHLQLFPLEKLQEKDGGKGFKKVKMARFSLQKYYTKKYLEELVEEEKQERAQDHSSSKPPAEKVTQIKIRQQKQPIQTTIIPQQPQKLATIFQVNQAPRLPMVNLNPPRLPAQPIFAIQNTSHMIKQQADNNTTAILQTLLHLQNQGINANQMVPILPTIVPNYGVNPLELQNIQALRNMTQTLPVQKQSLFLFINYSFQPQIGMINDLQRLQQQQLQQLGVTNQLFGSGLIDVNQVGVQGYIHAQQTSQPNFNQNSQGYNSGSNHMNM